MGTTIVIDDFKVNILLIPLNNLLTPINNPLTPLLYVIDDFKMVWREKKRGFLIGLLSQYVGRRE